MDAVARWQAGARRAWLRLRRRGLRGWLTLERDAVRLVGKTAVAATLAWWLAGSVLGSRIPALAGLAAILTVQVTVKQTVARGVQQFVGVTVGVAATVVLAKALGVHAWSVGLVILASLLVGRVLRLGPQANQVAISALLVLSLGSGYGWARVWDTLLGAAVGVLVNMLVAPPSYVRAAGSELRGLGEDLGLLLTDIADGLAGDWDERAARRWLERARELDAALSEAGKTVDRGEESLQYNPLARAEAEAVARAAEAHTALEHVASQVRGIARALLDLRRGGGPSPTSAGRTSARATSAGDLPAALSGFAELLRQLGAAAAAFGRLQADDARAGDALDAHWEELLRAHRAASACREQVGELLRTVPTEQVEAGRLLTSVLVDADRLLHEVDPVHGAHTGAIPARVRA